MGVDTDGDNDDDAAVLFTLEGFDGGNNWGQSIAVFRNNQGNFKGVTDEAVGGKFYRSFTLLRIENREIIGKTETCPEDGPQGLCENPSVGQTKYNLMNNKLKEIK